MKIAYVRTGGGGSQTDAYALRKDKHKLYGWAYYKCTP